MPFGDPRVFDEERFREGLSAFFSRARTKTERPTADKGIIPFVYDHFYPYATFFPFQNYTQYGVDKVKIMQMCNFLSEPVRHLKDDHDMNWLEITLICVIFSFVFLAMMLAIFAWIVSLAIILVIAIPLGVFFFFYRRRRLHKRNLNQQERIQILRRRVDEANTVYYMDEWFSIWLGREAYCVEVRFSPPGQGETPNQIRYPAYKGQAAKGPQVGYNGQQGMGMAGGRPLPPAPVGGPGGRPAPPVPMGGGMRPPAPAPGRPGPPPRPNVAPGYQQVQPGQYGNQIVPMRN